MDYDSKWNFYEDRLMIHLRYWEDRCVKYAVSYLLSIIKHISNYGTIRFSIH